MTRYAGVALALCFGVVPGAAAPHPAAAKQCVACHADQATLDAAHFGQPVSKSPCLRCHDLKSPAAPYLILAHTHRPYAGRHCDDCHGSPRAGRISLAADRVADLCFGCHVQLENRLESAGSTHNLLGKGACTDCHDPHASPYERQLKRPREALCAPCHNAAVAAKRYPH